MQLLETVKTGLQRMSRYALRLRLDPKTILRREPEDPDEPYALVGALKKPRTPLGRLATAAPLRFEEPSE